MNSICQLCGSKFYEWTIKQAEINLGNIKYFKLQLCERCTEELQTAIIKVLYTCRHE